MVIEKRSVCNFITAREHSAKWTVFEFENEIKVFKFSYEFSKINRTEYFPYPTEFLSKKNVHGVTSQELLAYSGAC